MTMGDRGGFAGLDPCVHCGFCLQACPTFLVTGDESDGPRGRIALMRELELGALRADDAALVAHLDRCLGCRGCEPACPSGVAYGRGLEAARAQIAAARPQSPLAALALLALTAPPLSAAVYAAARALRATGIPLRLAGAGRVGFLFGMLAATREASRDGWRRPGSAPARPARPRPHPSQAVLLFRGCVMDGLFAHVHAATIRTLEMNECAVAEVRNQGCCGALHAHAGLLEEARMLARGNVTAFGAGAEPIVVNSAGCGAMLREYAHLLPGDPAAARFAGRIRDVTELLAERGPRPGAPLAGRVAYEPPCHLEHAQAVREPPRRVLAAIPGLVVVETPGAGQCCGAAGLYTLVQPELAHAVLAPKVAELTALAPDAVATGNPGCAMQLGAALASRGVAIPILHPVELLDRSYRAVESGL